MSAPADETLHDAHVTITAALAQVLDSEQDPHDMATWVLDALVEAGLAPARPRLRRARIFGGMDGATLFDPDVEGEVLVSATDAEGLIVWVEEP